MVGSNLIDAKNMTVQADDCSFLQIEVLINNYGSVTYGSKQCVRSLCVIVKSGFLFQRQYNDGSLL